jgi:WD40-like Beta Propeller Repeat
MAKILKHQIPNSKFVAANPPDNEHFGNAVDVWEAQAAGL